MVDVDMAFCTNERSVLEPISVLVGMFLLHAACFICLSPNEGRMDCHDEVGP
jgi:hypothetical protein